MPRPSTSSTTATTIATSADGVQHVLMREQIQRLKAKALALADASAAACDDSFREPQRCSANVPVDNHNNDDDESMLLPPPPQHYLRLKRRLPAREPEHVCLATQRCSPLIDRVTGAADVNDNEFVGPDGCFKLPRLLHPVLERQNATTGTKRAHEPLTQSPRASSFVRPRRVLPCVTARAVALRLVQ